MPKTKVEVYDKDQLIYPYIESDHVTFSNGMKVSEMLDQSISMPTVTHEDLSFKVGVGDQDVSSAIVDSSVSEMTIKGKTYQNILPEPSTHVLTNNKEMFKVNEGLDPNVEIVDGVSKSAILSGQTLVNLQPKGSGWSNQGDVMWYNKSIPNSLFKPNTKYFLKFNSDLSNILDSCYLGACNPPYNYKIYPSASGCYAIMTTNEAPNGGILHVYPKSGIELNSTILNENVRFVFTEYQEGMENWDIPYFEGMASCKMPVLTTTGKNLFDINGDINQKYSNMLASPNPNLINGATIIASSNSSSHHGKGQKIKVERGEVYTCSFSSTNGGIIDINTPLKLNYEVNKSSTFTFTAPTDCDEIIISFSTRGGEANGEIHNFQLEQGAVPTPYEPYKTNILTSSEGVVLRGIGDVKDTLDCLTGEVTERIGEYTIDGNENWEIYGNFNVDGYKSFVTTITGLNNFYSGSTIIISGDFKSGSWNDYVGKKAEEMVWNHDPNKIGIKVKNETASNVEELKTFLASNSITVQYELATPIIKTVDLSSSGNWEKIVLDGRQGFSWQEGSVNAFYVRENRLKKLQNYSQAIISDTGSVVNNYGSFVDGCNEVQITGYPDTQNRYPNENWLYFRVPNIKSDVNALKQYLSQNPITVWFQTATHQDSTQVKQPIFFKDGHIIQSSGADNSLIPTLDYQAKTSNSYVMDLMKPSTVYTMKAKSVSGTFTLDGTSFVLSTNSAITTPSTLTSKFLVVKGSMQEMMFLEGNVYSKTIPYFKGIKSAFEGEDKIEVLSTGKNLFDKNKVFYEKSTSGNGELIDSPQYVTSDLISVKPNTNYTVKHLVVVSMYDKNGSYIGGLNANHEQRTFTTPSNCSYIRIRNWGLLDTVELQKEVLEKTVLQEGDSIETYEPYKSNSTKIPLLSPLRSLPNGVCDEIILDRENNKAKIIQRVVKIVLNGSEAWYWSKDNNKNSVFYTQVDDILKINGDSDNIISNTFANQMSFNVDREGIWFNSMKYILIGISKEKLNGIITRDEMKRWVSKNPITVHYQLNTPIITEVDLEGFPYIYKDGHVFLNSEIIPTTEIIYSVNQCQQISASNEDIIRHEKELTYLQKLIAQYVQVDYESALLSLKV